MKKSLEKKHKKFTIKSFHLAPNKYTSITALAIIVVAMILYSIMIYPYWSSFINLQTYASGF